MKRTEEKDNKALEPQNAPGRAYEAKFAENAGTQGKKQ